MEQEHNNMLQEEEITFKELFFKIKEFAGEIFRKWYIILLFIIPFVAYFYYKHITHEVMYSAETKFILEGQTGGGMTGFLSQFGIGAAAGGKLNPYKVIEVAKSKLNIREVLFNKLDGEFLANRILDQYRLIEKWSKISPQYKGFKFESSNYTSFDSLERSVLLNLIGRVIGNKIYKEPIIGFAYDEDTGIFTYSASTTNEDLTMALINGCYQNLITFFEDDVTQSQGNASKLLREKADSLKTLIDQKTYQAAKITDRSFGLVMETPNVQKNLLEKEVTVLASAYAEVLKNYEITDINRKNAKPLFVKLDEALTPLEPIESSLIKNIAKAFLFGSLVGSTYVIFAKIFRDALA
jgi:hypothetical protein